MSKGDERRRRRFSRVIAIIGGWFTITDQTHITSTGSERFSSTIKAFAPPGVGPETFSASIAVQTDYNVPPETFIPAIAIVGE